MATAKTKTLLPLDTFARYAGIHPLHFNQVTIPDAPPVTCGDVLLQYSWQQSDKTGREELAQGIADAENLIISRLNFPLAPTWVIDDRTEYPSRIGNYLSTRYRMPAVKTKYGHVITGGQEAWSLVAASVAVVYNDSDADGYAETATVSVPTTVTDVEEIAVVYPGLPHREWEIRPIKVVIVAGTATITFRREQAVKEVLLEALGVIGVAGMDDANFLDEVDVYRHYNDPSKQVNFVWEGQTCCDGSGCEACGYSVGTGCLVVRDNRQGLVVPDYGVYDAAANSYTYEYPSECRSADRLRLWYKAGWRNLELVTPNLTMDPTWGRCVTYLALALLDRPLCQCDTLRAFTGHWAEDLAESKSTPSGSSAFQLRRLFDNPIGTTRAAIYAWKNILRNTIGEGVVSA